MKYSLHLKSTTFAMFFASLVVLAVSHRVALSFSLYWVYPWFDIAMHFLGGVVVVLGLLTLTRIHELMDLRKGMLVSLGFVFAVGALWEIFEYSTGIMVGENGIFLDTSIDFLMDILGGTVGFLTAYSLQILDKE